MYGSVISGIVGILAIAGTPFSSAPEPVAHSSVQPRADSPTTAPTAVPTGSEALPDGYYWAPLSALPDSSIEPLAVSDPITAGNCTYRQVNDNVHISSTPPTAASGHGWWQLAGGTCPSTANVDIVLQAVLCGPPGCDWNTVASGSSTVRPGGGSGKRATGRETCAGTRTVGWRSYVDVDLTGVSDPSGYTYSVARDLACYPSSW